MAISMTVGRDIKWLTLEVCREFQRGTCLRSDAECKFAHPSPSCHVENGRVIACFDSLKGRCIRDNSNAVPFAWGQLPPLTTFPVMSSSLAFNPYLSQISPGMGLASELLPSGPHLVPGSPTGLSSFSSGALTQKQSRTDKLEVCREFQRGNCSRGEGDCRYAHPLETAMVDCCENSVIVCMDYIKGRCGRDKCKYFHPLLTCRPESRLHSTRAVKILHLFSTSIWANHIPMMLGATTTVSSVSTPVTNVPFPESTVSNQ
ncbi:hypothetical protein WMY93_009348 [Mugilogobius chulae]|uniref:C3H1-type domain-containing protein n=1 Tax=Mugilogobius chulae TaxID=88201 RepID=A0AAW0PCL8_9GOBI